MFNKRKAIILDVDEPLLQYSTGLSNYVKDYYDLDFPTDPYSYDITTLIDDAWKDKSVDNEKPSATDILTAFNDKSYQFGLLEPTDGAVEYITKLYQNYSTELSIIVLTKCGTGTSTQNLRKVNLINAFGNIFTEINIIDRYQSKRRELYRISQLYDVLLFVDDYIGNVKEGIRLNIPTVAFKCNHNSHWWDKNQYTFSNDWKEIYEMIERKM